MPEVFIIYIKPSWQGLALRKGRIESKFVLDGEGLLLLASLGTLCTVLGTGLHTAIDTLSIQSTTDDVVTNTGKVLTVLLSPKTDIYSM